MERNRWETALRCLEVAVHPNTSDDEMIAGINGFRRTAEGKSLSEIVVAFATGGMPLPELAALTQQLDRLNRENLGLRRKLAIEEAAQASTARRLDAACRRIFELTEEAAAAQTLAETVEQEFEAFRAAYARALDGAAQADFDAKQRIAGSPPAARRPFSAFLAEARLAAGQAAAYNSGGTGSGRLAGTDPGQPWMA